MMHRRSLDRVWRYRTRMSTKMTSILSNQSSLSSSQKTFSTSPFPFRPGYGLGSWIPPPVIQGMEMEAKVRSKLTVLEQILTDLESTSREITLEINAVQNEFDRGQALPIPEGMDDYLDQLTSARTKVYGDKMEALKELFTLQQNMADASNPQLSYQAFNSGAMSPVKWATSQVAFVERASDSMTTDARFFNFDKNVQSANSFAKDVSSAAKYNVKAFGAEVGKAAADAVHKQVVETAEDRTIESTLLLTATATHSKVMQFNKLDIDDVLLTNAWNFFFPDKDDELNVDRLTPLDLYTVEEDDTKMISLCTECFMGSALIGMVHYIKTASTDSLQTQRAENSLGQLKFTTWFGALTGDTSVVSAHARKAATQASQGQFDVKFHIMCLGYTPSLKSKDLKLAIKEFKDFDPARFIKSGEQETGSSDTQKNSFLENQNLMETARQSNMKSVISATVESLAEATSNPMRVLDFNTFMEAFDDYAANAPNKDGVGIPVGLNTRSWTRAQIAQIMWKKYISRSANQKDEGAGFDKGPATGGEASPA